MKGKGIPVTSPQEIMLMDFIIGNNAKNCLPVGTKVRKVNSDVDDKTDNGRTGTVEGSIYDEEGFTIDELDGRVVHGGYVVHWDDDPPNVRVFAADFKIEEVK